MALEGDMATAVAGEDEAVTALYDHRIVTKPGKIPKDRAKWLEWRFDFENFMTPDSNRYEIANNLLRKLEGWARTNDFPVQRSLR